MEKMADPSDIKTQVEHFTQEQLEKLSKEEGNKVYEWTHEEIGKQMSATEIAHVFGEVRDKYERYHNRGMSDDDIREKILREGGPMIKDFEEIYSHMFFRITEEATTPEMVEVYKAMIVMRKQIDEGHIEKERGERIISEMVNKISVREATEEEKKTGRVKEKMWKGKLFDKWEKKDPLNAPPKPEEGFRLPTHQAASTSTPVQESPHSQLINQVLSKLISSKNHTELIRGLNTIIQMAQKGAPFEIEGLNEVLHAYQSSCAFWSEEASRRVADIFAALVKK